MLPLITFLTFLMSLIILKMQENNHRKKYKAFYSVPSPPTLPFIGNVHQILGKSKCTIILRSMFQFKFPDFLSGINYVMNNCESTLVYVPKRLYITSIAEEIKIILNHRNSFNKSEDYNLLKYVYSKSLFTAEG